MKFNIELLIPAYEPIRFAIGKLQESLRVLEKQQEVKITISFTNESTHPEQSYSIIRPNSTDIDIVGTDIAGVMYGILDIAQAIRQYNTIENIQDKTVSPYLLNRGIKFNIPLDSRTPSYSDSSDSALRNIINVWDLEFWKEFLDRMAMNKYNVLSLWSLSPFPSMVKIPEYPLIALRDVKCTTRPFKADLQGPGMSSEDIINSLVTIKKMTIEEKISFWQQVMEYAKNRCIKVFIFTWNLFTYGAEGNPYGITCSQDNPITKDYLICAVKAMIKTYPLLAGVGVTAGENMKRDETDIPFIAQTYGEGIRQALADQPDREFRLIHRMQYTGLESIEKEFSTFPYPFEISFKYSQAHMYVNTKPAFINKFLAQLKDDRKVWLTIRNDDFYMYRWGDPDFAREYIMNMPRERMMGYYMGSDGYTWGRDYISIQYDQEHPLVLDKMWYMFAIWGQLSYDPTLPNHYFVTMIATRFPNVDAKILYNAWQNASKIIPEFQCTHFHEYDFQFYPEGCCRYEQDTDKFVFADINEFISCNSSPGSGYLSVKEYSSTIANGVSTQKISPLEVVQRLKNYAKDSLDGLEQLKQYEFDDIELAQVLGDIRALSYLGEYYAFKLEAAVYLQLFRLGLDEKGQIKAADLLREAFSCWKRYVKVSKSLYKPQLLTRMKAIVDVEQFIESAELDILLALEN